MPPPISPQFPMSNATVVRTWLELRRAAARKNALIHAAPGVYRATVPLVLADGVALVGKGGKLPKSGGVFPPPHARGSPTRLRAAPGLVGDILVLGNGASVTNVLIEDVERPKEARGNLIVVSSRKPDDIVSATVERCQLINPFEADILASGPVGRGILVVTRNPLGVVPPAPHAGSTVSVIMKKSLITSSKNGTGVFAVNFAPRSRVVARLSDNVIEGGLDAAGGISRPAPVSGSETIILSDNNTYRTSGTTLALFGWFLHGGTNPPVDFPPFNTPTVTTNSNTLIVRSTGDRIEGFQYGIVAAGGTRPVPSAGTVNLNTADLELENLSIKGAIGLQAPNLYWADLVLLGARSALPNVSPGDNNCLRLTLKKNVAGDGRLRGNLYAHAATPAGVELDASAAGVGNRLEIIRQPIDVDIALNTPPPDKFYI